jgi:archaellum component FlaC
MNPLIVTIIIAPATFIISIFGASWLNQQAMNKRIDDLRSYLDAKLDTKFEAVDAQFDAVRAEIKGLGHKVENIDSLVDRIERQLDQIFKPVLPKAS